MFDYVIRNARVIDGLEGESQVDVCIQKDKICELVPQGEEIEAAQQVDAKGYILTPGFVDIHRHADLVPFFDRPWIELPQGITSMISGNCGFSVVPNTQAAFSSISEYALPIMGMIPERLCGINTEAFYDEVESLPMKVNCGYLVGNGSLRRAVAGFSDTPLNTFQAEEVCRSLDDALAAGALGLSLGIMYTPECYYSTKELVELARVVAKHDKPVIAHIRGEGRSVSASVDEMISIGRLSGARVHISHLKAAGSDMWGHAVDTILEHIMLARQEGIDITFDAYPYTAGSTTLLSLFPPESLTNGTQGVLKLISTSEGRSHITDAFRQNRDGWDNFVLSLGWERIMVSNSSRSEEVGKTIMELSREEHCDPNDFAYDLLLRENGNVTIILEEMDENDVRRLICEDECIVISDALYSDAGKPHPRKYGAFERFLCQYVKVEKRLTLQRAIDKITRMPAEYMSLDKRGRIKKGYYADLVLLDWERLQDLATYRDPTHESVGISKVFMNGKLAFSESKTTSENAGVLLNRSQHGS